ncbi:hypothetical protein J1N35_024838 [Gossypium stocksii]|uniref:Retrotransposon gag domain-containing protein n=1 Tax=Gossypium stocksii TaxID=47602 RepID=A0A9D3ZVN1_9ROSI|nr:hypothetical protein J1N35_024838 [Gossypium stocksii]
METRFQEFKEKFCGDLQLLLGQYFSPPPGGSLVNVVTDKGKGVLGAPPGFVPKETVAPQVLLDPKIADTEGRVLEWQHFYSQQNGGIHMLSWPVYMKSMQDRFGFRQFGNPMKELANISHYLDLFEPSTLVKAFQLARKIEVLLSHSTKKATPSVISSPRYLSNSSIISGYSSTPIRPISGSQSVGSILSNKLGLRSISPTLMAERKQKGLCFWCGAKYQAGHKCVKSQLYQFLLEPLSDGEAEDFQEYSDKLEEGVLEDESAKSLVISLHVLTRLQGHNTMRVVACVGSSWSIILVDSSSMHNFIDAKLVSTLSLPVIN